MAEQITISDMAQRCGLTPHTLRYYERIGLIQPVARGSDGHRRYSTQDIAWVDFLTRLKATGMPIRQMLAFAALRRDGDRTAPQRRALLETHTAAVRTHIHNLEACLAVLQDKVTYYRDIEAAMTPPQSTTNRGTVHGTSDKPTCRPLRTRSRKTD
jgi:DNA-binding transcriptional MerR regulator